MVSMLFLILAVAVSGAGSSHQSVSLPAKVAAALRSNADQLAGLHVRGDYQHKLLGDPQEKLEQLGTLESEAEFTQRVLFQLWLGGDRLREQIRYPPSKHRPPDSVNETSFDSERFYSGTANPVGTGSRGILVIHTPRSLIADEKEFRSYRTIFRLWYLHAAGFEGPQSSSELGERLQSLVLDKISQGTLVSSAPARLDRRNVLELRVRYPEPWMSTSTSDIEADPNFQSLGESGKLQMRIERERRTLVGANRVARFVLDPTMNYAVVRIQESKEKGGELMFATRNSDFVDLGNGLWLPRKCEVTSYAYGTRPVFSTKTPAYVTTITIENIEPQELAAKDFQIWFDLPGVAVEDYTHAKARPGVPYQYFVAGPIEESSGGQLRTILIGVNLVIVVGLGAFLIWRGRHRRASSNGG